MSSSSPLYQLILAYMREHIGERLTAQSIAEGLIEKHPAKYAKKEKGLGGKGELLTQLTREVYARMKTVQRMAPEVVSDTSISIEVKVRLSSSDIREAFFQAVSNSLWANRAYLAAVEVKGEDTLAELNLLSSLHGVGYIAIDPDNFQESQILLPAREREEVDWASANRIAVENADFRDYLKVVLNFLHTGRVEPPLWDYSKEE